MTSLNNFGILMIGNATAVVVEINRCWLILRNFSGINLS